MRRPALSDAGITTGRATFFHTASRSRPRMFTVARSKPAAGTSCSSGPPLRPTMSTAPADEKADQTKRRADEARRLAQDGEDEVGVRLRQPAVFLDRMADADSKPSARGKSVDRLRRLEAGPQRVRERVQKRGQPRHPVRLENRQSYKAEAQHREQQDHVPEPAAAGPVGTDENSHHHHRRAEVALQHQQDQRARDHRRKRHEGLLKIADLLRMAGYPVGDEDRERELAALRRLEASYQARVEPT